MREREELEIETLKIVVVLNRKEEKESEGWVIVKEREEVKV